MRNNITARVAFSFLLLVLVTACSSEPRKYDFAVSVAGGPKGWPVWIENITFDDSWIARGGTSGGGFDHIPPGGAIVGISPKPAPSTVHARWFSYRTQTFYEVNLSLPEDLDDKLRKWFRDYPLDDYNHTLIVGFSGKGEALAWWEAFCNTCNHDRSHDFSTPLIENAQAEVVEGDPSGYRLQTQELVDEGSMPSPW